MLRIVFFSFFLFLFLFVFFPISHAQYGTYGISGYLFQDLDLDGSYDSGESILHHNTNAFGITNNPAAPVSYPATGRSYEITSIVAGSSRVTLTLPAGYVPNYPNNGSSPFHTVTVGPGCNVGTGAGHGATCSSGNINNLNFALKRVNVISGITFQDSNQNGTYEAGTDTPLISQTVTVTDNSGTPLSACVGIANCTCNGATCTETTDASGNYTFGPLFTGAYNVVYTPPAGYSATSPSPVTVTIP